jgi:hypothetical protein
VTRFKEPLSSVESFDPAMSLKPDSLLSTTARLDKLIRGRYRIARFADLSLAYQLSLAQYMAVDGTSWDSELIDEGIFEGDGVVVALTEAMPAFVRCYGEQQFGVASLPTSDLKRAVMAGEELEVWADWDAYHHWYCLPSSGPVPDHPKLGRWPVVLSSTSEETLQDGWHRLHCYARQGARVIPAVFFAQAHHHEVSR